MPAFLLPRLFEATAWLWDETTSVLYNLETLNERLFSLANIWVTKLEEFSNLSRIII